MEAPTFDEIFQLLYKCLKWTGIPIDNSRLRFYYYILVVSLIVMVIGEIIFLSSKANAQHFLEFTALLPCTCNGTQSILKLISITLKRQKLLKLSESLDKLYEDIINDETKRNLLCPEIKRVRLLTRYYFTLNFILICVFNFSSLVVIALTYIMKGELVLILPYPVSVPFPTDVFVNWLIVYVHSTICGFTCVLYYSTIDALYYNISAQVCANFASISQDIASLTPSNADNLPHIVKRHQHILKLSDDMEDIFTASNFINILVSSIEVCALGFNITFGERSQIPGFVLFLSSQLLQILVMSIFGENIIRESTRVGDTAYLCDWYNMNPLSKKIILTILIRTQKPQIVTAYKFSTICYQTFTKIMSTSWSYFTILRTVYTPEV